MTSCPGPTRNLNRSETWPENSAYRVVDLAVDAARMHAPAGRQGVFQGLDRHENIKGTIATDVKIGVLARWGAAGLS